ncbi:MAG: hypothetical protein ABI206_10305 [Antricoccus sp.]
MSVTWGLFPLPRTISAAGPRGTLAGCGLVGVGVGFGLATLDVALAEVLDAVLGLDATALDDPVVAWTARLQAATMPIPAAPAAMNSVRRPKGCGSLDCVTS